MKHLIPETQGIHYLGSKLKLLPNLLMVIEDLNVNTVMDGFSGSTRVSQALAKSGYQVISNDISEWSYILGLCYLKNKKQPEEYIELIDHLNSIKGYDGWFTEHYGGIDYSGNAVQSDGTKKPWQIHNTRKLDGIRDEIDRLNLSEVDRAVALTSLILALDYSANSLSHFAAYQRVWGKHTYQHISLSVPNVFVNRRDHQIVKGDIFDTVKKHRVDLAYFDPPYGSSNEGSLGGRIRYSGYYHVWTTIIKNDKPETFGVAHRRVDSSDRVAMSVFEENRKNKDNQYLAVEAIERLIRDTDARYIVFSYNSEGRASIDDLKGIMEKYGTLVSSAGIDYQRNAMGSMGWADDWKSRKTISQLKEFIFVMEKHE